MSFGVAEGGMESIAYVTARFPPYIGGIETHVSEIATRVSKRTKRVSILTTDPVGGLPSIERLNEGPLVYRVRSFAPHENFHFPQIQSFTKRLRECHSQILHIHGIHDLPGPIAGFLEHDSPIVFTPHFGGSIYSRLGKLLFTLYRPMIKELILRVDAVICVSRFEATSLQEAFPESRNKIHIIQNGVDFSRLESYRWRQPAEPTILFAGRLEHHKNVDKIIRAFEPIHRENPRTRLVIVGRGPAKIELRQLSRDLGLDGKIEWIDGAEKVRMNQLYSSSSVVVMPSEFEAYGLVAAEAISLGVPTIVANLTALSDFVTAGLAQPIDPPVTSEKVLARIRQVLTDPSAYSPRTGPGDGILSWDDVVSKTCSIYESTLNA
jgi:glycosyltransferase involved in cell wall biosynthesis